MGFLYPDNQKRANRVQQLASDIARLQTQIREAVQNAKTQNERAIVILDKISKQRGFKTLDEYIKWAESKLTPEDKKKYDDMKREFDKKDEDLDIAMKVGSGFAGVASAAGLTAAALAAIVQRNMVVITLQAVAIGLLKVLTGQVDKGFALFKVAGRIFSTVMKGEGLAGKVATAFRALKIVGKVVSLLGIAFEAVLLIYEAVDGARQRSEFQEAIKELCVRRMTTKKIQQYVDVTVLFASDAKSIIDTSETLQKLVDSGKMKQEEADAVIAEKTKELGLNITKAIEGVTDQSVYESLARQDRESQIAWTDEDPSLDWMIKKIEEEAKKEGDDSWGVPIEEDPKKPDPDLDGILRGPKLGGEGKREPPPHF